MAWESQGLREAALVVAEWVFPLQCWGPGHRAVGGLSQGKNLTEDPAVLWVSVSCLLWVPSSASQREGKEELPTPPGKCGPHYLRLLGNSL